MSAKMLCLVYFCVQFLIFGVKSIDGHEFRHDYDYYQEAQGWLKLHQVPARWRDARLMCAQEGAVLASPEDEGLVDAIHTVMKQIPTVPVHTGIHATYAKGHFYSSEGTPLEELPVEWAVGEPDNADNSEDCLLMQPGGKMADGNCFRILPYICYKRETPDMHITPCGTVDEGYKFEPRTNSCYKFHEVVRTWSEAFAVCSAEGAHLAIINSETEAYVLKELYDIAKPTFLTIFVGFTDLGDHKTWRTINGQTLKEAGYDKWQPGQPDNEGTHCGAMFGENGLLDDGDCYSPHTFVCEIDQTHLKRITNYEINYIS